MITAQLNTTRRVKINSVNINQPIESLDGRSVAQERGLQYENQHWLFLHKNSQATIPDIIGRSLSSLAEENIFFNLHSVPDYTSIDDTSQTLIFESNRGEFLGTSRTTTSNIDDTLFGDTDGLLVLNNEDNETYIRPYNQTERGRSFSALWNVLQQEGKSLTAFERLTINRPGILRRDTENRREALELGRVMNTITMVGTTYSVINEGYDECFILVSGHSRHKPVKVSSMGENLTSLLSSDDNGAEVVSQINSFLISEKGIKSDPVEIIRLNVDAMRNSYMRVVGTSHDLIDSRSHLDMRIVPDLYYMDQKLNTTEANFACLLAIADMKYNFGKLPLYSEYSIESMPHLINIAPQIAA